MKEEQGVDSLENIESLLEIFNVDDFVDNIQQLQVQKLVHASILEVLLDFFWASFEIIALGALPEAQDDDFETVDKPTKKDKRKKDKRKKAKRVSVENGLLVLDLGDRLLTSTGEHYGSFSKNKLLRTARVMVEMMASRGVKQVRFDGSSNSAALVALQACKEYGMTSDYQPNERYKAALKRAEQVQIKMRL